MAPARAGGHLQQVLVAGDPEGAGPGQQGAAVGRHLHELGGRAVAPLLGVLLAEALPVVEDGVEAAEGGVPAVLPQRPQVPEGHVEEGPPEILPQLVAEVQEGERRPLAAGDDRPRGEGPSPR